MSLSGRPRIGAPRALDTVLQAFLAAIARADKSFSPLLTLTRLRHHRLAASDAVYILHIVSAVFWLSLMQAPPFPAKLLIPALYTLALLLPITSQFFLPATPVFAWLLTFYTSKFIPTHWRPTISVSLLPTLESVLYGANISDILTRFTHPILDILAWIPYGVGHYISPFFVAAFLWLFRTKQALQLWARVFGYLSLTGVIIQILLPCSPPWYEVIYGLTPANYGMRGSPAGLARIDALFHSNGYTTAFTNSPLVFGAFPSLHAGWATLEALFLSHFFPATTYYVWAYASVLYWATMYLTHHYLIDVVGGACLSAVFFYLFMPDELRGVAAFAPPGYIYAAGNAAYHRLGAGGRRSKYEAYDLEDPRYNLVRETGGDLELSETSSDEGEDITYRSPVAMGSAATSRTDTDEAPVPQDAVPRHQHQQKAPAQKKMHRHTASIASLIRGEERSPEDGWSPVGGVFKFPPNGTVPGGR